MALINCPECSNSVSDKAFACPRCGYPISQSAPPQTAEPRRPFQKPRKYHRLPNNFGTIKGSLASAGDLLPSTLNAPAITLPAHLSFRQQSDTLKPTTKHTAPFPNIIKILTIQATPISHFGKCLRFIKNQKNMSFSKKKASHQSYRHTSIVNAFMTWKSET